MRTTDRAGAMAQRYHKRVEAESMPVEVVLDETEQGLRPRVVVRAFEARDAAQQALEEH